MDQCYGSGSSSGACNVYSTPAIAYAQATNASCPFASPDICIDVNSAPMQLDSGPIDSHVHLGINAPLEDRVTY